MSLKRLLNPEYHDGSYGEDLQEGYRSPSRRRLGEPGYSVTRYQDATGGQFNEMDFYSQDQYYFANTFDQPHMDFSNQTVAFDGSDVLSFNGTLDDSLQQRSDNFMLPRDTSLSTTPFHELTPTLPETIDIPITDTESSGAVELICYGMIFNEKVKLVGKGEELDKKVQDLIKNTRIQILRIHEARDKQLFLKFADGMELGYLSEKMLHGLKNLINEPSIEFDAVASLTALMDAIRRAQKPSDAAIRVNINVYGPESEQKRVGKELSNKGLFLQTPDENQCRKGVRLSNPHFLRLEGMDDSTADADSDDEEENCNYEELSDSPSHSQNEDIQQTMEGVFGSLTRGERLTRLSGSDNLNKALYPHQEEALDFMIQRETGNIPAEYRLWKPEGSTTNGEDLYCHTITNLKHRGLPDESGGGILADEMGMGKSLTTLVLIAKTRGDSYHWVDEQNAQPEVSLSKKPCHATLIIVPSLMLINTWIGEIKRHLGNTMKYFKYHGRGRSENITSIENCDIVITTYKTLAGEHTTQKGGGNRSLLHDYSWYRVVLDEAHTIRRQTTTFYQSAVDLSAKSRWCLSGTPVQNTLIDLGSLLAFIRVKPFHNIGNFRHWIANPFEEMTRKPRAIERLVRLLDAICLRRTIVLVKLPGHEETSRDVTLTPEEREQYEDTRQAMQRFIIQQAGEYNQQKSAFGMFQVFLELRSLCNHGTYQRHFSGTRRSSLLDDEDDAVCSITRTSLTRCSCCRVPMPVAVQDRRPKYAEDCKHVLCDECLQVRTKKLRSNDILHCPLCKSFKSEQTEKESNDYFKPTGHSAKMAMLVSDVQKDLASTQSIIFSCWTRTLDLIQKYLREADIPFSRIDGKTSPSSRQRILDDFDGERNVPVLIMTTGTGAFGLNLRSVNRIFIVEPQWNPSVESQAIARAIRLGQTEQVLVIRYRVEDSIEQDMYSQQKQKLKLSKMDFKKDLQTLQDNVA